MRAHVGQSIRIPPEAYTLLVKLAIVQRRSISQEIAWLVEEHVRRHPGIKEEMDKLS